MKLRVVIGYGGSRALRLAITLFKRIPTRFFYKWMAWRRGGLIAGQRWKDEIFTRLRNADALVMVWTSESPDSFEARRELRIAVDLRISIIPFVEEDSRRPPQFSGLHEIEFKRGKASLRYPNVVDNLKRLEPIVDEIWEIKPEVIGR